MLPYASLTAATLFALLLVYLRLGGLLQSCLDYPQFYFAAQLVAAGKIHLLHDTAAYQPLIDAAGIPPGASSVYFNRPAFAALLFWPLSWFSFATGKLVFIATNIALGALLIWKLPIWLDAPRHLRVWLICFLPFVTSAGLCQDTLAVTLVIAYSLFVLIHRNESLAGALLTFALIKPHLALFLPVALWLDGKFQALRSFFVTGAVLGLASLSLVGFRGIQQWLHLLAAPTTDLLPELMGNLRALSIQSGTAAAVAAGLIAAVCGLVVLRRGTYSEKLSVSIFYCLLFGPHIYPQDFSLVALIACLTPHPFIRYGLLIPWYYFVPRFSFVPVIWLSVACIAIMSVGHVRVRFAQRWRHHTSPAQI